jgi:hypothetical protein
MKRLSAQQLLTPGNWTPVPSLQGLSFDVPTVDCVIDLEAELVAASSQAQTRVLGIRLERSFNGQGYGTVREPTFVTIYKDTEPVIGTAKAVLVEPDPGAHTFRVSVIEDSGQSVRISPTIATGQGTLQSDSVLGGALWCP